MAPRQSFVSPPCYYDAGDSGIPGSPSTSQLHLQPGSPHSPTEPTKGAQSNYAFLLEQERSQAFPMVAAYHGDLLPGYLYADWAAAARERMRCSFLGALLEKARQDVLAGQVPDALEACHRVLEIDPWPEDAVLVGMQAYLKRGDRAGALDLYRALEETLREELDTAPQASLRTLYESLL